MLNQQDVLYRQLVTLADGTRVLLRFLTPADRQALRELYAALSPEDMRYLRQPVSDPKVVESRADMIDYAKVLPLAAFVGERMVGDATLHFGCGPTRHIAEVHIFLTKDFRRRGLGTQMIRALIDLARRRGLHYLLAQIVSDQTTVIKAFEQLGFERKCTMDNFFMFPDGELRDVAQMVLTLRPAGMEF